MDAKNIKLKIDKNIPDKGNEFGIAKDDVILKRELGLPSAIGISLGQVIGSGIFIMPKGTARGGGSVGLTLLMWILGGLFTGCGALATAELATLIPKSGGGYNYLKAAYGQWLGFLYCFKLAIFGSPSSLAIMALTFSKYTLTLIFQDGCGEAPVVITKLVAVLVIVVVVVMNCYSVNLTAKIHVIASTGKVLALIMIIIGGVLMICKGQTKLLSTGFTNSNTDPTVIAFGFYSCMFAYVGWESSVVVCEEVKNPSKNIPKTLVMTVAIVTVLYFMTNVSYLAVMSVDELLVSPAVGVTWASRVIPSVSWLMPVCVGLSTFGSINASVNASSRYHFVLARERIWPAFLAMINVKRYTPVPSVMITLFFTILYVILGDTTGLLKFASFITYLTLVLKMAAVFILRRTMSDAPRPYKTHWPFPVLYGSFVFALFLVPLVGRPQIEFLYATLMQTAGLVLYIMFVKCNMRDTKYTAMDKLTCFLQLLLQVSPQSTNQDRTSDRTQ